LWNYLIAPLIVVTLGALISRVPFDVFTRGRPATPTVAAPKDVIGQILQRPIWSSPPTTFSPAIESWTGGRSVAAQPDGEPVAVTPEGLTEHGPVYEKINVALVGMIAENVSLTTPRFTHGYSGISDELRLLGANGTTVFLGANEGKPIISNLRGHVIIAIGRIAALGIARLPDGHETRAVYFLAAGGGLRVTSVRIVTRVTILRLKLRLPQTIRSAIATALSAQAQKSARIAICPVRPALSPLAQRH
jgi:hypothetical protein